MTTARPWEQSAPRLWETAQPLFDRVISIRRPNKVTLVGAQPYSGLFPTAETVLFTGIAASIQFQPKRYRPLGNLPSDATTMPQWHIYVPGGSFVAGHGGERAGVTHRVGRPVPVFSAWAPA